MRNLLLLWLVVGAMGWRPLGKTRTVKLTQGDVVGMVYQSDVPDLGPVEVYRGVPYAQAERFMPPSSPSRFEWLDAVKNGPVCPQNLVDLDAGMKLGSGRSTSGRLAYLRRLIPFLKDQSEDCLNLNIYVPSQAYLTGLGANLNVIVFIHGESFSWNSGNPYDGSTLASYGNIIFVTLNFRLGILGFLNTKSRNMPGNFGLLDQIAALRWLKDNISEFGGDPNSITVMGHHTGAIAVNYLMLSPMSQADNGLFQRAILMSGTAMSNWAHTSEPEEIAEAVAEQMNCPKDDLLSCLRDKRLQDILSIQDLPEDIAPSVDGIVVKVPPKDLMSHNNDLFTRYDLLCGVTESESHHILDTIALKQGMYNEDVKELLTKYFKQNYEYWEQSMDRAMKIYGLDRTLTNPLEGRDKTLTLLSDARVVAPMVQAAVYHSTPGVDDVTTFFYVFSHKSKHGDHPMASVSVQGEDLGYVLGVPIQGGIYNHFPEIYTQEEKHLSETMMSLWINFAKTGNPNLPRRQNYLTKGPSDWVLEDVDWPAFEPNNQHYYQIQIPPRIGNKYRDNLMHFWNYFLPSWVPSHSPPNKITAQRKNDPGYDDFPRKTQSSHDSEPDWSIFPPWRATRKPNFVMATSKPKFTKPAMDDSSPPSEEVNENSNVETASSFTLSLVIILGVCFLVLNLFLFAYIWYQKKKLRKERLMARYRRSSAPSITDEVEKSEEKCEIKSILKSNERLYDPLKVKSSGLGKWTGLYSHGSSSTVTIDPHTKVSQWMKGEKANIGIKARTDKSSDTGGSAATTTKISRNKVKKVSVAVDATPSARSASVLKQIPIELSKSMDFGKRRLGATMKPSLHRSFALDSEDEIVPNHSHSISDPVEFLSTDVEWRRKDKGGKSLRSFEPTDFKNREYHDDGFQSADEALDNFKRRNYPKVLPDFPSSPALSETRLKRMSLPVASPVIDSSKKVPPPPPPRLATVSRHPRNRTTIPNFTNPFPEQSSYSEREEKTEKEEKRPKKEEKKRENKIEKRAEPRVIIKPTLSDPNQKKVNSKIPRVTHQPDSPKDQFRSSKDQKTGSKAKSALKKSTGTDPSGNNTSGTSGSSSVSSIATVKKAQ